MLGLRIHYLTHVIYIEIFLWQFYPLPTYYLEFQLSLRAVFIGTLGLRIYWSISHVIYIEIFLWQSYPLPTYYYLEWFIGMLGLRIH
jgi:hypothetical protein